MARIKTYSEDSIISESDIVIGSDSQDSGSTKNYTFSNIIAFLQGKIGTGESSNIQYTKYDLGIENVDNTSDINKPVSIATQTSLDLKADISGDIFTGPIYATNLSGSNTGDQIIPTASSLGIENVDNTSDINKPISIANQNALNLKANISGQIFTGNVYAPNIIGNNTGDQILPTTISLGLENVNNTSDINKPISLSGQSALNLKEDKINKNAVNGYAGLGADGKIISSQLPSLVVSDTYFASSDAEMTSLTNATTGDICIRTDQNKTYILKSNNYSTLSEWTEFLSPTSSVTSVFGRTGAIQSLTDDYTTNQIKETSTRVFQTPVQRINNNATSPIQEQFSEKVDKVVGSRLITSSEITKLVNTTNINSGDETLDTIKSKLMITTLSGANTGDETLATIKTKLGITTLSGSNTGDQVLPTLVSLSGVPTSRTITINGVTNNLASDMVWTISAGGSDTLQTITTRGNTTTTSITALAFYQTSDARLKNIISQDGDTIKFTWKDNRDELIHTGYVAQEVQKIMPDQVQTGDDGMLSVNYIEVLVQKIKDLENKIKQLEK